MSAVWVTIVALAAGTILARAADPLTTGDRRPSGRGMAVTRLVAPAILGGLVVYETFAPAGGAGIAFDARLAGLGAAGAALAARLPMLVVVLAGAAATALVRALF